MFYTSVVSISIDNCQVPNFRNRRNPSNSFYYIPPTSEPRIQNYLFCQDCHIGSFSPTISLPPTPEKSYVKPQMAVGLIPLWENKKVDSERSAVHFSAVEAFLLGRKPLQNLTTLITLRVVALQKWHSSSLHSEDRDS